MTRKVCHAALEIEVVEYVIKEDKKNCPFAVIIRFPSKYKPSIVSIVRSAMPQV